MYSLFFLYLSEQIYKIMKIKLLLISFLLAANALGAAAQVSKTYYVSKPGTLISMMTEEEANSVTHLTLTGKLNAEDFRHLRDEFDNLKVLDISNAEIKMYSGKAGTYPNGKFYIYMPNFIPAYAFSNVVDGVTKGKATLEKVILSEKTKNIEDAAFKGCENLKICQIRKKTAPNLLPEALADSVTAIFVPLGSSDSYRYKDRWQNFAFIEGEPVETTLQVGAMGKLEEEILKAGLQPRDINFLTVEGKLDNADFKLIRDYMPNLVSVDISRTNATAIPDFTFAQKKYLLNMKLPHNLKSIGQRVFSNCGRLCGTLELPARANGWAMLTACELLDVLPEDYPQRAKVMDYFRAHVRGVTALQSGEGLWHQLLDRNDSYLETSATAIYVYCLAHAINKGWIDAIAYGPVAHLGWHAVAGKINAEGQVEGTCVGTGMAFDPAFYYYRPVNVYAAHGYGPVLWAGAEMIRLLKNQYPKMNDSAVQYYQVKQKTTAPIFAIDTEEKKD